MLGPEVAERFGGRLPFLTKVLAVDQVLSLQVHPGSEQAQRGHAREEAAGLPPDSPERSYPDPWHKPELVFALTPFETLAGFRDVSRTAELLRMLGVPWADDVADAAGGRRPGRRACGRWWRTRSPCRAAGAGARRRGERGPRPGAVRRPRGAPGAGDPRPAGGPLPRRPRRARLTAAQRRGPAARRGADGPARGGPRARVRSGARDHGHLRQRPARGTDPEAPRRRRAARRHRLPADPAAALPASAHRAGLRALRAPVDEFELHRGPPAGRLASLVRARACSWRSTARSR